MSQKKCSIHVEKVKVISGLDNHNNRKKLKDDAKPYIDKTRSHLNYDLISCKNYDATIKEKLNNAGLVRKIRKDAVLAGSFCVNAPTTDNHSLNKDFFKDCVEFLSKLVGKENVVAAQVHNDEKTPHLHFVFVPIIKKPNKKKELVNSLSYKDLIGSKPLLRKLQTDFFLEVGKKYGLARGEPSDKKHISTREYRANAERMERLNIMEKINREKMAEIFNLQAEVENLKQTGANEIERLTVENAKKIESLKAESQKGRQAVKNQVAAARGFFAELDAIEKESGELEKANGGILGWSKKTLWANFKTSRIAGAALAAKVDEFESRAVAAENRAAAAQKSESDLKARFDSAVAAEVERQVTPAVRAEKARFAGEIDFLQRKVERLEKNEIENSKLKVENAKLKVDVEIWKEKWNDSNALWQRVQVLEMTQQQQSQKKGRSR